MPQCDRAPKRHHHLHTGNIVCLHNSQHVLSVLCGAVYKMGWSCLTLLGGKFNKLHSQLALAFLEKRATGVRTLLVSAGPGGCC
jgi:hypothetical protein